MELPFSSFISRGAVQELRALTLGRSVAVAGRVGEAAGTQRKGGGGGGRAAAAAVGGGGMMASTACSLGWASMGAGGARAPRNPCLSAGHHDRQKFYITRLAERGTRPAKKPLAAGSGVAREGGWGEPGHCEQGPE